jgi:hypothetical protein
MFSAVAASPEPFGNVLWLMFSRHFEIGVEQEKHVKGRMEGVRFCKDAAW